MFLKGIVMRSQVLSLLCGISFAVSSPVFGMELNQTREEAPAPTKVARAPWQINNLPSSPLENLPDELKIQAAKQLNLKECCMLEMTSKRWNNFFYPHKVFFSLPATLRVDNDIEILLGSVNFKNREFSLVYHPESMTFPKSVENPFLLCSYAIPEGSKLQSGSYCPLKPIKSPLLSCFKFHENFFESLSITGVPIGWGETRQTLEYGPCTISRAPDVNIFCETPCELMLRAEQRHSTGYPIFSCRLEPAQTLAQRKKADMVPLVINMFKQFALTPAEIRKQCSLLSIQEIKKILEIPDETKEEGFERLRPEIRRRKDAGMSNIEIADELGIPDDLVDVIMNSKKESE